jgi:hypothetical protein
MKLIQKIAGILLAVSVLTLSACSGQGTASTAVFYTEAAQTMVQAMTETAALFTATATEIPTLAASPTPAASNTPLLTSTLLPGVPTSTPFVLNTAAPTGEASPDNYSIPPGGVDVTIPDNSVIPAGTVFTKTWNVINAGPSTWASDYTLIFGWGGQGTNWSTVKAVNFGKTVPVGANLELSVSLTAPKTPGNYSAAFRLQNDVPFTFGPALTVVIVVQ